jgi:hypothetical protein
MQRICGFALAVALSLGTAQAWGQSSVFNFEDGTDQGFGAGFGNDASATFPIDNVGGSLRMRVLDTGAFQQAGHETGNAASPFYQSMLAASLDETLYQISYDWYIDTSVNPGGGSSGSPWGSFLQLGTYVNTGSGYYAQDFPGVGKDVELNGTQLASGQVFSGTVTETFAAKGFNIPAGETFFRLGLISNGDGTAATVHFDNIRVSPVIPEPASLGLAGLALVGLAAMRRRSR